MCLCYVFHITSPAGLTVNSSLHVAFEICVFPPPTPFASLGLLFTTMKIKPLHHEYVFMAYLVKINRHKNEATVIKSII